MTTPAETSGRLQHRLHRLEQTIAALPCTCPNPTQVAWPGHTPDAHCPHCACERTIILLAKEPSPAAFPLLQETLPTLQKAATPDGRLNLATLTDHELGQLKTFFRALE